MNILLVGGAGYLGGALTDILQSSDHHVLVYDRLLYEETYRKDVPFVRGDVRDYEKIQKYFDWADAVVWLAALVGDPACALNESLTMDVNKHALQYMRDHFDGRILNLSSCSVYGAGDNILDETSELQPLSLYAKTKVWSEQILNGANSISFRLGTLYGLSDAHARIRFDLVVNTLVMRAILHGKMSVFGGEQYRPLLHVRDVGKTLAENLTTVQTGVYNLHAENMTIIEIAERVEKAIPGSVIEKSDVKFQDNRNYRVSSDKARRELGFDPLLRVDDGIRELRALLEDGRVSDSFTSRYSNYLHLRPLLQEYTSPLGRVVRSN